MNHPRRVGVIGSGLGGLAAACTLAARGHRVTLIERNAWLGGKAAVLEEQGFRFDMGPTILTLPSVLRRIFAEAGHALEDRLQMVRCDPQWRCFFTDGSVLDLHADEAEMSTTLEQFAPGSSAGYQKFMAWSRRLEEVSQRFFFWKSVGSLKDTFDAKGSFKLSTLADVMSLRPGRTVHGSIRGYVKDGRVAQMLDHFTQYVGSAPDQSPAVLCGIAHMQTGEGIWYPMGGTRAVPLALERLARELGVEIRCGLRVQSIRVEDDAARGVVLEDGESLDFDAVVSNADAVRTHRELLGWPESRAVGGRKKWEPACSGVVLYLGLDRAYEQLQHHNFVFSEDPEREFQDIYGRGEPAEDPTCYVCAPSRSEAAVAPPGGEALYVLVHTPYLRPHHDWKAMLPAYREVILDKLASTAGLTDIRERIVYESTLTPQGIHDRYQVLDGAIYGTASHGRFLGAFKPANRSSAVRGLYLAGGAAHPGPGMPMVLMSGWIAADSLDQDHAANPEEALSSAQA
jgi:phytoene desaturase